MKILQLRGEFSDNGPGSQTLTIAEELRKRGHEVVFCSSGGKLTEKIINKGFEYKIIKEISLEKRNFFNVVKAIIKLSSIIKKENIEIIHTHNAASVFMTNIASIVAMRKIKVFQSVRGVEIRPGFQWRNMIYKLNRFNALFAVSQFTKNILTNFGVNEDKIIVTYNGTDLKRFDISKKNFYKNEIRKELDIPLDAKVIGIVGRQDGNKGHRLLVQSFFKLYEKYNNLYIILVGEGIEMDDNIQLSKNLDIYDRCRFVGLRLDVEKFHASFDIFTLLSKKGLEMFPNVIIESMSYANPFVATNTTGVPETAKNGEGFICECEDVDCFVEKFDLLLENDNLRISMGKVARQSVENNFNIGSVVDKIEKSYEKCS